MKEITQVGMEFGEGVRMRAFRHGALIDDIRSYTDLRIAVAELAFYNPSLQLFFRGQRFDSRDKAKRISLFPSIFRDQLSEDRFGNTAREALTVSVLTNRWHNLALAESLLLARLRYKDCEHGFQRLRKTSEAVWAILQHYEVVKTPLLDVTASLDVALSFAFADNSLKGALYVIGIPANPSPLHFDYVNDLAFLRLSSLIPPTAPRPHFQSACLVGPWPVSFDMVNTQYDVALRLVAGYMLDSQNMITTGYQPIDSTLLFPESDKFKSLCDSVRDDLNGRDVDVELTPNSGLYAAFLKAKSSWRGGESYVELVMSATSREVAHRKAVAFMKRHSISAHCSIREVRCLNRSSQWSLTRSRTSGEKSLIPEARKKGVAGNIRSFHPNGGTRVEAIPD